VTSLADGDLPVLRSWLKGTKDHPLHCFFRSRRTRSVPGVAYAWWRNPILVAIEETLELLETAEPPGIGFKRREFRGLGGLGPSGMEQFRRLQAELIVASLLAGAGIPFQFNKAAGPDLLLGEDSPDFGIEVSSRSPQSLSKLSMTLSEGLRQRGLPSSVSIVTDPIPPVAIRADVRDAIVRKFLPPAGGRGVTSLRAQVAPARPEHGIPASWATISVTGSQGYLRTGAPFNSPHMVATAQHVAQGVLRERRKVRQARALPTLLIVDLSASDLPDLRRWEQAFEKVWEPHDAFLAVGSMVVRTISREPTLSFSINPFADGDAVAKLADQLRRVPAFKDLAIRRRTAT
jgi:hypothetical protein